VASTKKSKSDIAHNETEPVAFQIPLEGCPVASINLKIMKKIPLKNEHIISCLMLQFDLTTVSETVFRTALIFCYITNNSELNMMQ